jgi:hypothetical protein
LELQKANKRGRKFDYVNQKIPPKKRKHKMSIPSEIRYDNFDHYPLIKVIDQASRCCDDNCTFRTRYTCGKYECSVCPKCMKSYHIE